MFSQEIGRIFLIGKNLMEVPHYVLNAIRGWDKSVVSFDKRFVAALLLCLTAPENLVNNNIPQAVMEFVRGIFDQSILFTVSYDTFFLSQYFIFLIQYHRTVDNPM